MRAALKRSLRAGVTLRKICRHFRMITPSPGNHIENMRPKKVALSTDCGYMEKGGEENREAAQSKKKKI